MFALIHVVILPFSYFESVFNSGFGLPIIRNIHEHNNYRYLLSLLNCTIRVLLSLGQVRYKLSGFGRHLRKPDRMCR